MTCTALRHGTPHACHRHGCTCPAAVKAYKRSKKVYYLRRQREGHLLLDRTGSERRLQALRRMGWPLRELARQAGLAPVPGAFRFLVRPDSKVHADTAARIRTVYDRLCMTPGPDKRARLHAERQGWPPPLAWDDDTIDDPQARPVGILNPKKNGRPLVWDEITHADILHLRRAGISDVDIATRYGIKPESLERMMTRAAQRKSRPAPTGERVPGGSDQAA